MEAIKRCAIALTFATIVSGMALPGSAWAQSGLTAPEELTVDDIDYWQNLCNLHRQSSQYEAALAACEQAISLAPKDAELWTAHSEILLALEQYPGAIVSAERAFSFDSENALALTYQCRAYSALNQAEAALSFCNQASEIVANQESEDENSEEVPSEEAPSEAPPAPNSTPSYQTLRYRGNALERAGQLEQALIDYEQLRELDPTDALTLAYLCRTQVTLERYEVAIDTCQQAIAGNGQWAPESEALAFYQQGLAFSQLARYEEAVQAYDLALESDPDNADIWIAQGQALQAQQSPQQLTAALTSYARAIELAPTNSIAHLSQCTVMNQLSQYETAAEACQQAIQAQGPWLAQGEAEAWNQWGQALSGQGMQEEALAAVSRAVGMRPDYAEAWNNQSVIYWYLGTAQQAGLDTQGAQKHYRQAIAAVQRSLELSANSTDDTDTNAAMTRAYANLGRYHRTLAQLHRQSASPQTAAMHLTAALNAYRQALELTPADAETWVNKSVVLWLIGDYPQALTAATQAVDLAPDLVQAWQAQAVAHVAQGEYAAARISYQAALQRNPDSADAWAGLGAVSLQLGDQEAGIAAIEKALQIDPAQSVALRIMALAEQTAAAESP